MARHGICTDVAQPRERSPELLVSGIVPLLKRPTVDRRKIDGMTICYSDSLIERLTIAPMVEGREAIHHALRRSQDLNGQIANRVIAPFPDQLTPYRQGPGRKLDCMSAVRMNEVPAGLTNEPQLA